MRLVIIFRRIHEEEVSAIPRAVALAATTMPHVTTLYMHARLSTVVSAAARLLLWD